MLNSSDETKDAAVIENVLAGDVNAFETIIDQYKSRVFFIVSKRIPKEYVDEVAHDVFVRAFKGLAGFKGKGGFQQWLSGISVRACYDFWREKYRRKEIPISCLTDAHREWLENITSGDAEENAQAQEQQTEILEIIEWALCKLSAADRTVIELVYLDGYTHKEASELTGWSIANIKVRSFRAKKKLYAMIVKETKRKQNA
jgi:RNA polymerase sigma-70 factor (ECF subfamily)